MSEGATVAFYDIGCNRHPVCHVCVIAEAGILLKLIEALERSLLDPCVRQSTWQLNKLIADDFLEFGSSGKVYNKQDCIKPDDIPRNFVVSDFKIKELSKDVTLATYNFTIISVPRYLNLKQSLDG